MTDSARQPSIQQLSELTRKLRIDIIDMITAAGSGHPGGSLSAIDLVATLFASVLRHDPKRLDAPDRDHFILSKGHAVPALYAVLAHHGYIAHDSLRTLRQLGSPLQGHPVRGTLPGVEACTGSLGQGLSIAQGIALAARLDGRPSRVFCLMGDGEIQEGQVWEAAMSAAKYRIDNLVGIVDYNKGQIDGLVSEVMPLEPLADKWAAFGWSVRSIDGHDFAAILDAYAWATKPEKKPKLILANTIKGKGVSFMEHQIKWHGAAPSAAERDAALAELERAARSN